MSLKLNALLSSNACYYVFDIDMVVLTRSFCWLPVFVVVSFLLL